MTHTPGPWFVSMKPDQDEEGWTGPAVYDRGGGVFAVVDEEPETLACPFREADASLIAAAPDLLAFRKAASDHPEHGDHLSLHLYTHDGEGCLRARMFAPNSGTIEDPATGSANATIAALLLSLSGQEEAAWNVVQGVEMGRPSRLRIAARRAADGVRATVGGGCVPVFSGQAQLD